MAQNNTEQEKPFCIFGIGELGKMFCDTFADKLRGQCKCCVVNNLAELQEHCASDAHSDDLFWMLIAEYDQDIWEKSLENDEIKRLMREFSVKYIIIHPKNNTVTTTEQQFIRLIGAGDNYGTLVFAMPEMTRKSAMKTMCQALYDIIAACSFPGYVNIEYGDLFCAGRRNNWYGMIYHADCSHSGQMTQIAANIKSQVERELPAEGIKSAVLIMTTEQRIPLMTISNVAEIIENMIDKDARLIWGHVNAESECSITLVVFREMA